MERLTTYKNECNREMICRFEDCMNDEEHCPHLNEDNCNCLQSIIEKLAEYEDAEENGLLLRLPCKIGDPVFVIRDEVEDIYIPESYYYIISQERFELYMIDTFGKYVFLTEAEAYRAMKKMQVDRQ